MLLWDISRTEQIIHCDLTSNEIPSLDQKRSYFLFSSLIIRDENGDGETGKGRAARGLERSYFSEKDGKLRFTLRLEISQIRLQNLLEGPIDLLGPILSSEAGDCEVPERNKGGRAPCSEFLMCYQRRVFSHFSVLLYKVHFL